MTIKEMRKLVCIRANALIYRQGWKRKSAFREAWEFYKAEAKKIKTEDLKPGDVIRIALGCDENVGVCTVLSVERDSERYWTVRAVNCGRAFEFCARTSDKFNRAA